MSVFDGLTREQIALAEHGAEAFVQACPGAGKTRTVVARLTKLAETLPPRKGVAVLSFTNSAVDEFKARCLKYGCYQFLRMPSFVGTFDGFVRHFIVMPGGMPECAERPIIIDSWDTMGIEIRLAGRDAFNGDGVSLDRFDPTTNAIDPEGIAHAGLRNHVTQHRDRYVAIATARRNGLLAAGYMSANDARARAHVFVADAEKSAPLARALAARFQEVIVDEAQDCDPFDLAVVSWLRAAGIRVTMVSDIDQSIYAFRDGDPAGLRALNGEYEDANRLGLTGNFRSAPAICTFAATLRGAGNADEALGEYAESQQPVVVLAYNGNPSEAIGRAFLERVEAIRLTRADAIVLAHRDSNARRAAGDKSSDDGGGSKIEAVARAVSEFWANDATPKSREDTLRRLEGLLLDVMDLRQEGEHVSRTLRRLGISHRIFRRQVMGFVMALPKTCPENEADRDAWIACVREQIEKHGFKMPEGKTIRATFPKPPRDTWLKLLEAPAALNLRSGTIHNAKGREYKAVCVVIPPCRAPLRRTTALFDAWEAGTDLEAKRVIYVGATRAEAMLAIAVPRAFADRCVALLQAGNVAFERRDI